MLSGARVVLAEALKVPWTQVPMYNTITGLAAGVGLLRVVWFGADLVRRRPVECDARRAGAVEHGPHDVRSRAAGGEHAGVGLPGDWPVPPVARRRCGGWAGTGRHSGTQALADDQSATLARVLRAEPVARSPPWPRARHAVRPWPPSGTARRRRDQRSWHHGYAHRQCY